MSRESWKKKGRGTTPPAVLRAIERVANSRAAPGEKSKRVMRVEANWSYLKGLKKPKPRSKLMLRRSDHPVKRQSGGGKREKKGSVLSRLIIHFRQLATNYLPFSSICPSHDRKANVWQAHRWVGNSSLMYGKLLEFSQYLMMKNSRWDKGLGVIYTVN